MEDAVSLARRVTPPGGVVLLSPAAPSYGHYRDYIERGRDFAATGRIVRADGRARQPFASGIAGIGGRPGTFARRLRVLCR